MTGPDGEAEPARVHIDARAEGRACQIIAGRDLTINTGLSPAPTASMHTLPRDVAAFTGRDRELRRLIAAAATAAGVITVHTVDGMPGVGKTALVTHAGHRLTNAFPDGQLFVDLHAHTPGQKPADPSDVLARLLACTGMASSEIPEGVDARAERWRSRLAGKKILLILDDVADSNQIEPLLPGAAKCLVLVTSRRRLIALNGAESLALSTLPPGPAVKLFSRLTHRALSGPESATIAELAGLCGYLPLAIALLAGRLAHHPNRNLAQFINEFAAAKDRLAELAVGSRAVAAAFELSYQDLSQGQQRLFRRLGLHPGPDIDAYAAAALDNISLIQARHELDALYADHLLDEHADGRYGFHDLLREYARSRVADDQPEDRQQCLDRLLDYYQHTAETADSCLTTHTRPGAATPTGYDGTAPDLTTRSQAMGWMRTEHANFLGCIQHAAKHTQPTRVIALTAALSAFLRQEGLWEQATALHQAAVTIAHHVRDRLCEADALNELGRVRQLAGDISQAADLHGQALALYRDLGNRLGEAGALRDLGRVRYMTDDYGEAADLHGQALALYRDLGNRLGDADALNEMGRVAVETGNYQEAADLHGRALALYGDLGNRLGEAGVLRDLGHIRYMTGDYSEAADLQRQALALYRDLGSRLGEAGVLWELGRVAVETGNYPEAADLHGQALALFRSLGDRLGEGAALGELGRVAVKSGDYSQAADLQRQALALFRSLGNHLAEAEAINNFGALMRASGDPQGALIQYRQALQLARQVHSPLEEAHALEGAARCQAASTDMKDAVSDIREAVNIYRRIGAAEANAAAAFLAVLEQERLCGGMATKNKQN